MLYIFSAQYVKSLQNFSDKCKFYDLMELFFSENWVLTQPSFHSV